MSLVYLIINLNRDLKKCPKHRMTWLFYIYIMYIYVALYKYANGHTKVLMTKGRRLGGDDCSVNFWAWDRGEKKSDHWWIRDRNIGFGKKFAFVSRPSGKSKNWREKKLLQKAISLSSFSSVAVAARRVHY